MELSIRALGEARQPSPLQLSTVSGDSIADFTPPNARVFLDPTQASAGQPSFELAGPRALNYFRGPEVTAAIVTVGGLCPGMNNVVRELVLTLWHRYGVRRILGARYGFRGLMPDSPEPLQALDPGVVRDIHLQGGTVLGSSRGPQPVDRILGLLQQRGIDMVFCIGGDGGMNGARALYEETRRRAAPIAVVGVPKTIDNDLPYIERTFGFDTAVSIASGAIRAAHVEARSAPNGVGLVRLMGRHAGFIAAAATLAAREVNLVLVPELPFAIEGERGLLAWLWQRLDRRDHAVIVVAEGAGQEHLTGGAGRDASGRDASGNVKLGDIGVFLRDRLIAAGRSRDLQLKYIDPSYIIRATPATPSDAIFCGDLAESAVHAAMAGKTGLVIGLWLNRLTHLPLATATDGRKTISLDGSFWRSVINCTGQPAQLV
ncbi:MAG: ATP-dependent 6-phosphofructokinase [Proteobacteria bacterium]|nr:ATP-dependent 6-phosphofructokinase [Pseudomonadota bacterium]